MPRCPKTKGRQRSLGAQFVAHQMRAANPGVTVWPGEISAFWDGEHGSGWGQRWIWLVKNQYQGVRHTVKLHISSWWETQKSWPCRYRARCLLYWMVVSIHDGCSRHGRLHAQWILFESLIPADLGSWDHPFVWRNRYITCDNGFVVLLKESVLSGYRMEWKKVKNWNARKLKSISRSCVMGLKGSLHKELVCVLCLCAWVCVCVNWFHIPRTFWAIHLLIKANFHIIWEQRPVDVHVTKSGKSQGFWSHGDLCLY